jgi:RNA polymerase sigma-70 factor (ECF subfamily)
MNKIINLFAGPGDQDRFRATLAPHVQLLYQQAYRFTLNTADAEDLLQDVLLETFRKREVLYAVENAGAWLSRCLYHRFVDRYRRQKRQPQFDDIDTLLDHSGLATQGEMETQLVYREMLSALQELSPKYRAVVSLHDQLGFTLPELESIMDIPLGTLKSHLHRARKALKKAMDDDLQSATTQSGGHHEV